MKKINMKDVIEVGNLWWKEEDIAKIKWKDFEVQTLTAIRGETDKEYAKTTNK